MRNHHWNTWGLLLIAVALQVSGLHSWREALTPVFIGGCLLAAGTVLKAMVQDSPNEKL